MRGNAGFHYKACDIGRLLVNAIKECVVAIGALLSLLLNPTFWLLERIRIKVQVH
jgi:hypothetical protein